ISARAINCVPTARPADTPLVYSGPGLASSPRARYRRGDGVRVRRRRYRCPPGCWPARLASLYDDVPWSHLVTLTAPPGRFRELWASWRGLDAWSSLGDAGRPEWQAFWLVTLANHDDPHAFDLRASDVHAHLLVGGVPWEDLERE